MNTMSELASYAPLSGSLVRLIARYVAKHPSHEGVSFYEVREQATRDVVEAVRQERLDTTWLCKELTSVSPEGQEVTRDLLWLYKQKGALRYVGEECPSVHSATALVIARRFHRGQRRWTTPMTPGEPLFYCKIEIAPGEPVQMIAYPFEQDGTTAYIVPTAPLIEEEVLAIPPRPPIDDIPLYRASQEHLAGWYKIPASALVHTPYGGVIFREDGTVDQDWLRVDGGAIRFFGPVSIEDVARWDRHVARMNLDEEDIPDIVATAKVLALQLLARERRVYEHDTVSWKAPR